MKREPRRPSGTDAEAVFMQWVWDSLTKFLKLKNTPQIEWSYQENGIVPRLKIIPGGGAGPAPVASDYAGVWAPGTYSQFQWVVIQAGPGQGAYISTANNNNNDPRTGINWVQFSSLNQWF